jgi:integrase
MAEVYLFISESGNPQKELLPGQSPFIHPRLLPAPQFYHTLCKAMQLDLASAFLFRTTIKHTSVSSSPFLVSAARARLVTYLKLLGLYTNETIHGFRGGIAILLSLLGASKDEIAKHFGWSSTQIVDHYTQVDKVLAAGALWRTK